MHLSCSEHTTLELNDVCLWLDGEVAFNNGQLTITKIKKKLTNIISAVWLILDKKPLLVVFIRVVKGLYYNVGKPC